MGRSIEVTDEEIALLIEALQDATFYRDTRSHVLRGAVRKRGGTPAVDRDEHRAKARAYEALVIRLKGS